MFILILRGHVRSQEQTFNWVLLSCLSETIQKEGKIPDPQRFFCWFSSFSCSLTYLNVSHNASTFPSALCCDAFNAFIQCMEFCISSVLKQVFNFSGISGCANDHLPLKNERTHNSAATHKYGKVQNWRLQYAIWCSVFVPCSVQFIVGEACTYA